MNEVNMEYRFPSLRIFIAGFTVLIALFLFSWMAGVRIDMAVNSEPFIINFDVVLDQDTQHVLFNLNTIPAQVVSIPAFKTKHEYIVLNELKHEENNVMLVFKYNDLKKLVVYKAEELLKDSEVKKQVFEFHQDLWEIRVKDLDMGLGSAAISVFIQEQVIPVYDYQDLKNKIRFKSVEGAKNILHSIFGIKRASINVFPPFYNRIPIFDSRIKFFIHP